MIGDPTIASLQDGGATDDSLEYESEYLKRRFASRPAVPTCLACGTCYMAGLALQSTALFPARGWYRVSYLPRGINGFYTLVYTLKVRSGTVGETREK